MTQAKRWTIGEVVAHLKARFPDVTESKVRFWERQGFLHPCRTGGGHRLYSPADVRRLEIILHLRVHRRLPLRVVREILAYLERRPNAELALIELFFQTTGRSDFRARSLREVQREMGWSDQDIAELIRIRLIRPCPETNYLEPEDIAILEIVRTLRETCPITWEDLRLYVHIAHRLARYEQRLLRQWKTRLAPGQPCLTRLREIVPTLLRALYLRDLQHAMLRRWSSGSLNRDTSGS